MDTTPIRRALHDPLSASPWWLLARPTRDGQPRFEDRIAWHARFLTPYPENLTDT